MLESAMQEQVGGQVAAWDLPPAVDEGAAVGVQLEGEAAGEHAFQHGAPLLCEHRPRGVEDLAADVQPHLWPCGGGGGATLATLCARGIRT